MAVSAAIAAGRIAATSLGVGTIIVMLLAGLLLAGASLAGQRWSLGPLRRRRRLVLLVATCLLGGVRGGTDGHMSVSAAFETGDRGLAEGMREFEVTGASSPGAWCRVSAREETRTRRVQLTLPASACPLWAGQRIRVLTRELRTRTWPRLPGDPDPRRWAQAQGSMLGLAVDHVWRSESDGSAYWRAIARVRQLAWDHGRGDDALGFLAASTLGVRSALAPDRRRELRAIGLGHLVAVSGMHVGIAAWLAYAIVLRLSVLLGSSVIVGVGLSWVPLLAYVGLTGAAPPAVRAGAMVGLLGLSAVVGRPAHGLTILAVVTTAMLAYRPAWVLDPGFQLSVVAMAALVRTAPGAGLLAISWRLSWAILPVALLHFGSAPMYGVLGNLFAVPVFTLWVLPWALWGWMVWPWLGPDGLTPARWGAHLILDGAALLAELPPVPVTVVVVAAGVTVVARLWADGAIRRRPWLGHLLPPLLACLGTLAVHGWLWWQRPAVPAAGTWWAIGGHRSASVLQVGANTPEGCLRDPGLSPRRWSRILDAVGVQRVTLTGPSSLHLQALERALAARGRLGSARSCSYPEPVVVRAALDLCLSWGASPVAVRKRPARPVECFHRGTWLAPGELHCRGRAHGPSR